MNRRISKGVPSTKKQSKKSVNTGLLEASGDSAMTRPKSTNLRISTRGKVDEVPCSNPGIDREIRRFWKPGTTEIRRLV